MLFDHIFCHEAYALRPVSLLGWLDVYSQVQIEVFRIILKQELKLIFEKDVIDSPISKHHFMMCLIFVPKSRLKHMVAWSDSSSTAEIANLVLLISEFSLQDIEVAPSLVLQLALWALYEHFVSNIQFV